MSVGKTLAMILAGGEGRRLAPLTHERSKPAVTFGGRYRIIDFVLSNFANSGVLRMKVLTQYKSESLNTHISRGWRLSPMLGQFVESVPAQQRTGPEWYKGSADAIYQNLNLVTDEEPDYVFVFGADHIYRMDVRQMLDFHLAQKADCTVAAIPMPIEEASSFGIITADEQGRMIDFQEKPRHPKPMIGNPRAALVSMGNYLFTTEALVREIVRDAGKESAHDFGIRRRNAMLEELAGGCRTNAGCIEDILYANRNTVQRPTPGLSLGCTCARQSLFAGDSDISVEFWVELLDPEKASRR